MLVLCVDSIHADAGFQSPCWATLHTGLETLAWRLSSNLAWQVVRSTQEVIQVSMVLVSRTLALVFSPPPAHHWGQQSNLQSLYRRRGTQCFSKHQAPRIFFLLSCRNWFIFSNQEWAQCSCLLKVKGATMHNISDPDPVYIGAMFCHVSAGHTLRLRPWGPIDLLWFVLKDPICGSRRAPNTMKLVATTRFFDAGWDWVVPEVVRGSSWKFCEAHSGPTGAGGSPSGFFHPRRGANH